jgi:hypothetical protein
MKILIILATGAIITFPVDKGVKPDCFSQGYSIMEKISMYQGPEEKGKDQGWYLNGTKIQVGGWYCE